MSCTALIYDWTRISYLFRTHFFGISFLITTLASRDTRTSAYRLCLDDTIFHVHDIHPLPWQPLAAVLHAPPTIVPAPKL